MSQQYSNPRGESDPWTLPDVEVFYARDGELERDNEGDISLAGWYYWYCFPGCMPDSEPYGPFDTEQDAVNALREANDDLDEEDSQT